MYGDASAMPSQLTHDEDFEAPSRDPRDRLECCVGHALRSAGITTVPMEKTNSLITPNPDARVLRAAGNSEGPRGVAVMAGENLSPTPSKTEPQKGTKRDQKDDTFNLTPPAQ